MRVAAFTVAVILLPPVVTAAVWEESFNGPGWHVFSIRNALSLTMSTSATFNGPAVTSVVILDDQGNVLSQGHAIVVGQGAEVAASIMGSPAVVADHNGDPGTLYGGSGASVSNAPELVHVIAWATGDDINHKFRLSINVNAQPEFVYRADGTTTFYIDPKDVREGSAATAQASLIETGAAVLAMARFDVQNTLFGHGDFAAVRTTDVDVTNETASWQCACRFLDGTSAPGAGTYTVSWTGLDSDVGYPVFAGADVRLPTSLG